MSSKDIILKRLRKGQKPFQDVQPVTARKAVVNLPDEAPQALRQRFIEEAEKLSATVWQPQNTQEALDQLLELIGADERVLAWEFSKIPLDGLQDALEKANISVAEERDGDVRVGITGAHAAIAATGSIVLKAGKDTPRMISLLPHTHIAIIKQDQLLANMEAWAAQERANGFDTFKKSSHVNIITGASRTADIGMELVLGAHGPAHLHLMILD